MSLNHVDGKHPAKEAREKVAHTPGPWVAECEEQPTGCEGSARWPCRLIVSVIGPREATK